MTGEIGTESARGGNRKRNFLIFVLFLTSTLNFADRAVFSVLAQTIKVDLRLSDLQLGLLQGMVFALLYAASALPIGLAAERISRKRIIAVATMVWSVATATTGMAGSFFQLAAARLVVGMGEAGFVPPAASMVADVFPRQRRASAFSLVMLGTPVGTLAGATLAGHIAGIWDWRTAFLFFAIPGFLTAALLLLFVDEPARGMQDDLAAQKDKAPPFREFLTTVAGNRPLLWVIAGGSLAGFGLTSISQFLAVFLARVHELNVRDAATSFGVISGVSITVGLLAGSFGTDFLARRDPRWPAWGAAIGLLCAPPLYWVAFHAASITVSFAMLMIAGSFLLMFYGPTTGMLQNLLPTRMRASGLALYMLLYTLIGPGLGPVFVGGMSDWQAKAAYFGNFARDCPSGLPAPGASETVAAACRAASSAGLQSALSMAVMIFVAASLCFLRAASGLKAAAQTKA
ncbi:MAG: MFS transporter [Sphingobium sp.]